MTDPSAFTKLVPGFDFLQGLVKNAGAALPGIGQWVAPTIDPAELEKRIEELRTVQFWLEQNARMLGATIQALEVQKMTLSTLKTMNVQMEGLRDSLQIRMPTAAPAPEPAPRRAPVASPPAEPEAMAAEPDADADAASAAPPAAGVVDPLQWWGALTKQFTELATTAMKDTASDAARKMAGATLGAALDSPAPATKTPAARKSGARKTGARAAAKKAAPRR
ncbi:PhaM family polyhydroxyalkanoate granule multifunctional regulatory protein [Rhizobacter sp. Root404]|uniref:PhaM family polyhydroxyalkanoate granule multifunctional regulatory protein n=1 Tax=Rhizobacter sp. Root404 TaxID=1736528 RepID=UPI0006FC2950|nr:PhaM family polyhydroxyalkanoate granule multifunctional regulatory protein [Rhizobacter sp. Root404]KQW35209.1 hypothetical protein ASC76_22795 [Rhizobacter sp. Root404]